MPLHIINGNLADYINKVDAMVVPANKEPVVSSGLDGIMFEAAGFDNVIKQRRKMGRLRLGQAKETNGFKIAKYLIHTATPLWLGGTSKECDKLKECYINSIKCADRLGLKSIAFPLLSSGNMGFPLGTAYETATAAINERLSVHDSLLVYLVLYYGDISNEYRKADNIFYHRKATMDDLEKNYKSLSEFQHPDKEVLWYFRNVTDHIAIQAAKEKQEHRLQSALPEYHAKNPEKTDNDYKRERFYEYFENCGLNTAELARMIQRDKATVSRIRNGDTKKPQKRTVIALAIAMGLDIDKRYDFINCSGHSYPSEQMDYMIEQLMRDGCTKVGTVSDMLYKCNKEWLLIGNPDDEALDRKKQGKVK